MQYSLAPMEGLTSYVVRNAFYHNFDCFDTYYTPFIPAGKSLYKKTKRDVDPENNQGITLIPQVLCNHSEEVVQLARVLSVHGYKDLNVNLGCPSGTVANKGRGSGFLAYPDDVDRFLDEIYTHTDFTLSVKTRIGFHDTDNWQRLMEIYHKYPQMTELIIHPRTQKDFYKGSVRMEYFDQTMNYFADSPIPLCYNGDINTLEDYQALRNRYPSLDRVMIGRGAFRRPGLVKVLKAWDAAVANGQADFDPDKVWDPVEYRKTLRDFHDEMEHEFIEIFDGPKDMIFHMKEIWSYLWESFEDSDKYLKKIRKSQNLTDYDLAVNSIFRDLEISKM